MALSALPLGEALPMERLDLQRGLAHLLGAGKELKLAAGLESPLELEDPERFLSLGIRAIDAVLPHGGLPRGSVTELQVQGSGGAATSLALCACRAAQAGAARRGASWQRHHPERPWCAFVDPGATLFAPAVAQLGVDLGRLLVVRPALEALERTAVRIAEARAVSVLVIDARGALGELPMVSARWQRTVRRLALAVERFGACVLLITSAGACRSLPLPVALRLELARASAGSFELRVGKERTGRVGSSRRLPLAVFQADVLQADVLQADVLHEVWQ